MAAVLLAALLLGPALARSIAARVLSARIGGEVSIGSIEPRAWGRSWMVRDLRVRVRDWPGAGGEIAAIDRLSLRVDRGGLLRGEVEIEEASAEGVLLRIAEDADDPSRIAIMGLSPPPADAPSAPLGPLRIFIDDLRIEAGEVRDGRWELRGTRWFRGSLATVDSPTGPGRAFEFLLSEIAPSGEGSSATGLLLKGLVDADAGGAEVQVAGLRLDESLIGMTPLLVRQWLERFEIVGNIAQATIGWRRDDAGGGMPRWEAGLEIADAGLRLEDLGEDLWARYANGQVEPLARAPRMRLDGGTILMSSEGIELKDLRGRFGSIAGDAAGVPFELDFAMDLASVLPGSAGDSGPWAAQRERLARGAALAPFNLSLRVSEFRSVATEEGGTTPIDLPLAAARALEQLAATSWSMDLGVDLQRGPPEIGADGILAAAKVRSAGTLELSNGEGSYFRFPYPLRRVAGNIHFRDEVVTIHFIRGRGSGDSDVQIGGRIEYRDDDDVSLSLRIASENAVADKVLLAALDAGPRELLETLFDAAAAERLAGEGLLLDPAAIAALEAESRRIETRLDASGDPLEAEARERLERRRDRIATVVAGGPFVLGGRLRLAIDLEQGFGSDAPLRTTGTIDLQRAGVLLRGFPYPLVVTGGRIRLHDERIELEEPRGLEFVTPGGGFGRIRGVIEVPRLPSDDGEELRGFAPDLRVTVAEDQVNPALLAAIPYPDLLLEGPPAADRGGEGETAGEAAPAGWNRLIRATGQVDLHGTVQPGDSPQGDPRWSFTALASELAAEATESLQETLAADGLAWPADARLEGGQAVIEIAPESIRLRSMQATFDGVPVEFAGEWRDEDSRFELRAIFEGLAAPRWLRAASTRLDLAALATDGSIDCDALWRGGSEGIDASFRVRGGHLDLAVPTAPGSSRVRISLDAGAVAATGSAIAFEGAAIGLRDEDGGVGVVHLDGELPVGDAEGGGHPGRALEGRWLGGRAESPAVRLLVDRLLPPRASALLEAASPEGDFELAFRRRGGGGEATQGELEFACGDLRMDLDGERVSATADAPLRLEIREDLLRLLPSRFTLARVPEGDAGLAAEALREEVARVGVSLEIRSAGATQLDLSADLALPSFPFPGSGLLPQGVRDTVAAIDLRADATHAGPLRLEVRWPREALDESPESFSLDTLLTMQDAAFDAGVAFREVAGEVRLQFAQQPEGDVGGEASIRLDRALVRDRELQDAAAMLRYEGDRERILVSPIAARVYGGFLDGRVLVLLDEDRYELDLLFDEIASAKFLAGEPVRDAADGDADGDAPGAIAARGEEKEAEAQASDDGGRVRGRFRLGGSLANPIDRVGRGSFSIVEGRLGDLPVGLRLLQLAQLSLPIHESMADAEVRFHITGDRLVFERLEFFCDTLALEGEGHLDLATMQIDTRFASRGTTPLVSDLVAPITGTLFAVELVGPVTDPEAIVRPLPGLAPRAAESPRRDREADRVHIEP